MPHDASRRILIADTDARALGPIMTSLARAGFDAECVDSTSEAIASLASAGYAVALIDECLPCDNPSERGCERVLKALRESNAATPAIVLADHGSVENAVRAFRRGASDYLCRPLTADQVQQSIERCIASHTLTEAEHPDGSQTRSALDGVVGQGPRMQEIASLVRAVAPSKSTVLMCGESGTGKSLIARAIHEMSPRKSGPFVELSCGSIPETLLESELFGHIRGAFSGAHADKVGRFEAADGGTLFLDEINSASKAMQLKLLRVLQERAFEPVGSTETKTSDVRVVLATNQPLEGLVNSGEFRQDLYYRINVVSIELPPLRERASDIPALAEHFLSEHGQELSKSLVGFSRDALAAMSGYSYPGNVRELQNIVERAAVLCQHQTIRLEDLPASLKDPEHPNPLAIGPAQSRGFSEDQPIAIWDPDRHESLAHALCEPERQIILEALELSSWNRQLTADRLGINRATLYKKMKQLGINPDSHQDRRAI